MKDEETRPDTFIGSWLVKESVYSPSGRFIGTVVQSRVLEVLDNGNLRLVQNCVPDPSLDGTILEDFRGHFSFDLSRNGCLRNYQGPDVCGYGLSYGDAYLQGEGVWPRFSYSFDSWSILHNSRLQLTGGCFFQGREVGVVIIGVAVPQDDVSKTILELTEEEIPNQERGHAVRLNRENFRETIYTKSRSWISELSWCEIHAGEESVYRLSPKHNGFLLNRNGQDVGTAQRYGPLLQWDLFGNEGCCTRGMDLMMPIEGKRYSMRRHMKYGQLKSLESISWSSNE